MDACVLDSPVGRLAIHAQGDAITLLERTTLPLLPPSSPWLR